MAKKPAAGAAVLWALMSTACERGCGWGWLRQNGVGGPPPPPTAPGALPMSVVDCPDGIARCAEGSVEASRLARISQPCGGPESACTCPWEPVARCGHGCVAEGLEVVMDRAHAATQLCAPEPDAGLIRPTGPQAFGTCEEGQLYRCRAATVVDCAAHMIAASCMHECFAEGASIDEGAGSVTREAAFAILCSR
jgi:hypothetical protein